MLPLYWTVCFTTRASSRSKSIIPTPTAIPRSTSPPSPYWACASARGSAESNTSASIESINYDYGSLTSLVSRADQTIDTEQIAEQWDRMGQLYASLKKGHVTASVALKRLVGFSAKNRFYRANRDLGRIFKTEFILQYLSEPELRSRIRRGLLKVEQLHALARDVFYGRRGRINARELWEQMNTCSCLNLILACIIYWQGREISRVLSQCDPVANGIDLSLLEHVSPIEWDNIVLYGQYILDRKLVRQRRRTKRVGLSV